MRRNTARQFDGRVLRCNNELYFPLLQLEWAFFHRYEEIKYSLKTNKTKCTRGMIMSRSNLSFYVSNPSCGLHHKADKVGLLCIWGYIINLLKKKTKAHHSLNNLLFLLDCAWVDLFSGEESSDTSGFSVLFGAWRHHCESYHILYPPSSDLSWALISLIWWVGVVFGRAGNQLGCTAH